MTQRFYHEFLRATEGHPQRKLFIAYDLAFRDMAIKYPEAIFEFHINRVGAVTLLDITDRKIARETHEVFTVYYNQTSDEE